MKRSLLFAATAASVLAASGGSALAAGQTLCSSGPGKSIEMPQSDGTCKSNQTAITLATQPQVATLQGQVAALQSDNATLTSEVSALQTTLTGVSYNARGVNGKPTLEISGENVQIDNGSGATDATVNGLGNLFIGYDENPFGFEQTGSNNLVLGRYQAFTSYGGLIAGEQNRLLGPFSSITGGRNNMASGESSSVSGGFQNTASADASSAGGGQLNVASAESSSVSGGSENTASGLASSVSGGAGNTASGNASSILGGNGVTVSADDGTSP